ncbi:hypothetical protein PFISCL1PPCAC_9293, partial [Pristionchus fissidentatus]
PSFHLLQSLTARSLYLPLMQHVVSLFLDVESLQFSTTFSYPCPGSALHTRTSHRWSGSRHVAHPLLPDDRSSENSRRTIYCMSKQVACRSTCKSNRPCSTLPPMDAHRTLSVQEEGLQNQEGYL